MSDRAVTTQLTVANGVPAAPLAPQSGDAQAPLLGIETRPEGYATRVVVSGAIDLVTEQALHHGLSQALAHSEHGIELDLSGVDFCDCSGLNVLLRVRRRALDEGKIITIRSAGAAVLRLFAVTGTLPLFAGTGAADEGDETGQAPDTRPAEATPLSETDEELRIEVVQLRRAMQTRPVIDLARGVLMASFGVSAAGRLEGARDGVTEHQHEAARGGRHRRQRRHGRGAPRGVPPADLPDDRRSPHRAGGPAGLTDLVIETAS